MINVEPKAIITALHETSLKTRKVPLKLKLEGAIHAWFSNSTLNVFKKFWQQFVKLILH